MRPLRSTRVLAAAIGLTSGCGSPKNGASCSDDQGCQGNALWECVGTGNAKAGPSTPGYLVLTPCAGPKGCGGSSSTGYTCDISGDTAGEPCGGSVDEAPGAYCTSASTFLTCGSDAGILILTCPMGCAAPANGVAACASVTSCEGVGNGFTCMLDGGLEPECCSSACVELETDPGNCGACGTTCPTGQSCVSGQCMAS